MHALRLSALAAALAAAAIAAPVLAASPEVDAGRKVAQRACAGCHDIDGDGPSPHADAPPFKRLYGRVDVESLHLKFEDGMMIGHSRMPIARIDADDVVTLTAFLRSLQPMRTTGLTPVSR